MTIRTCSLLLAGALLAGCQAQAPMPEPYPQLTMGPSARSFLQIESVHEGQTGGNLLRAGVRLHNRSSSEQVLRYRFIWHDASGFELPGLASRWEKMPLRPAEPVQIDRIATSPAAASYQIYLFDINTPAALRTQGNDR